MRSKWFAVETEGLHDSLGLGSVVFANDFAYPPKTHQWSKHHQIFTIQWRLTGAFE